MAKIFRRIRYLFISENKSNDSSLNTGKMGRYLIYAVGEIILVVIGIMIALQVNNYREEQIARKFERTLLTELQTAMANDIGFFEGHLLNNRNAKKQKIHNYFKKMINGEEVDQSALNHNLSWLKYGNTFQVNRGAYESIKSSGLDKISSSEIRSKITELYEFNIDRIEALIDYSCNKLYALVDTELPYLQGEPVARIVDNELEIEDSPIQFDVKSNPHFLKLLKQSIACEESQRRSYEDLVDNYRELDSLINVELSLRN